MKKIFYLLMALSFLTSCEKKSDADLTGEKDLKEISNSLYFGKYSKEIMLFDDSGNNSALVKIGTNDSYCFQQMNSKNLILIPVYKGQSVQEAFDDYCERTGYVCSEEKNEILNEVEKDCGENGTEIHYYSMILAKQLSDNVEDVLLLNNISPQQKSGWQYETKYGVAPETGVHAHTQKATFYGQNRLHVGYYKLDMQRYPSLEISNVVSSYVQIRTGETAEYERNNCYMMIADLKFKGSTNPSVYVVFEY